MEGYLAQIIMFAGNFAPRGWAFCQGQILSIAQNTALFSLLGTTYGGNGTTTFALPDFRGRSPVGTGQGPGLSNIVLGELAGTETVTLLVNNMPAHNHLIRATQQNAQYTQPKDKYLAEPQLANGTLVELYSTTAGPVNLAADAVTIAGGSQPFANRNPYLGMNFVICMEGIYPSRN